MPPTNLDCALITQSLDLTLKMLQSTPHKQWKDVNNHKPDRVTHEIVGMDHYRCRIIPGYRPRFPKSFWTPKGCFYEIGIGEYPGHSRNSRVQFFMAANQGVCGRGYYNDAINHILGGVAKKRADLHFQPVANKCYAQLWIHGKGLAPDPLEMAKDIVWIIEETLPDILSLKSL
jgi:hypothetical protein